MPCDGRLRRQEGEGRVRRRMVSGRGGVEEVLLLVLLLAKPLLT